MDQFFYLTNCLGEIIVSFRTKKFYQTFSPFFFSVHSFTMLLVEEYFSAWSAITAKMHVTSTPLGAFYSVIQFAYACIALIRLYLTLVEKSLVLVLKERAERGYTQLLNYDLHKNFYEFNLLHQDELKDFFLQTT
ncbi:hypothetical protein BpHYR1_009804 [Brachionus plicatilis]|uniref:Uncharacterized protein n=1 Tax=Brachionus plicatilis TaxID=10195 RepID=A0A3M7PJC6_BRAPC|nr:hypothetical protein BpHYR1_009804 [Brachionus plicatilis]